MEFQFDPNQPCQRDAVEAVCQLFSGQPRLDIELNFSLQSGIGTVANELALDEQALLLNLKAIQMENGIPRSEAMIPIEATIDTSQGLKEVRFLNFSVEMETGTGKTYVYTRTALELFKRYGFRKFVIVVPSVAIREGVLKDLSMTESHFRELYGNLPYRFYLYDSANLSQVRHFAVSDAVELIIMTIDSFNKASNVIRQATDRLQGELPLHLVQATRPILILDEPQKMESKLRVKALAALDPLFALRYSATHRNPYNLVYRLTPFEAYRQGLVKRIEVASVLKQDDVNQPFARLERIETEKSRLSARVSLHQLMKTGTVKEKVVTVRPGDSLVEKSGRQEYEGFMVDEINPAGGFIRFMNNIELTIGAATGADKDAIFRAQIRYTIEEHFRKQARLIASGIKVLSLFFIDRVDNYALADGIIRTTFDEEFRSLQAAYPAWANVNSGDVQAAYFAARRHRGGTIEFLDSITGDSKEDADAYNLILKEKERLLSLSEPVSFIFSHSALREGWDNPNIFQICTLNQTTSEIKKRQEVGRGVRLCRDQSGARIHDDRINVLTVVANESYETYVSRLQAEIEEEYGMDGLPPKPANARKRSNANLKKDFLLRPEFKELWERIRQRTYYSLKLDTEALLEDLVPRINAVEIHPPRVVVKKAELTVGVKDEFETLQLSAEKTALSLAGRHPLPNLVNIMADLMENTTPRVQLTRSTLLEIFRRCSNKEAAMENPYDFATEAVRVMKDCLADHLVDGIQYEKIDAWYEMTQLDVEIESWEDYLVPSPHGIYDHVVFESEIERSFVEGLEARKDVKLYCKLPAWFKVPTPVGEYNPDWAIVMEERDAHGDLTDKPMLYLVRETKDANWKTGLRPSERRKVFCGERHFEGALGVSYRVVTTAGELP